ncbi:MAG: zinc-binding dehydrogenase [Chloroflexi bacterium]|nr:zinc-binding dehydrogenase [Chloroflexota bacterium]
MKAVYINEQGDLDKLTYGNLPEPQPGPGQVLVRVRAAALNHLDVYARSGGNRTRVGPFPHILGCDSAGEVAALGPGVEGAKVGQRVMVDYVIKCGTCDYCAIGLDELCRRSLRMGVDVAGGYAQYVKAPVQNVHPFPESMSFEEAASMPLVFHTAWHCLVTRARLRPGETVLINAAGSGVGSAAIQIARALRSRVLVTAGSDAKIARARELGAEGGVNYTTTPAFSGPIKEIAGGEGVDIVFDSVGTPVWEESFASIKRGGRFVTCGVTGGYLANLHLGRLFGQGISVMGSGGRSRREFADFMRLVNAGALRGVVARVFPLEEAAEAHRLMESRDFFGKIVLRIP